MSQRAFLGLTHNPFAPPRTGFFERGDRKTHLEHLRHLSQWSRRILVVTGPFGIGKSSLFRELSSNLEANTKAARLSGTVLTSEREVLVGLLQGFGLAVAPRSHAEDLAEQVVAHVTEQENQGRVCMAMVDDAHLLDLQAVRRLVKLVADSSLRLLLFSEESLVLELNRAVRSHELEWFEIRLTGLPRADVREYLEWRFRQAHYRGLLPFTDEQLENIVVRSAGNPSVIDSMANRLLGELESGETRKRRTRFPLVNAMLALSLVVMVALVYLLVQQPSPAPPVQPEPQPEVAADADQATEIEAIPEAAATGDEASPVPLEADTAPELVAEVESETGIQPQPELEPEPELRTQPAFAPESEPEKELLAVEEPQADPSPAPTQVSRSELTPEPEITEDSTAAPEAVEAPVVPPPVAAVEPAAPPVTQAPELFKDADWLLRQNPERYTLQMLTLSSRQRAVQFISRQQNQEEFALYSWQREGARLYVVTYGVFSGSAAARRTAESFSGELGRINPWVRSMRTVQETVRNNPQD
jgi:type II secretory pathway predicted ATPase ExeA